MTDEQPRPKPAPPKKPLIDTAAIEKAGEQIKDLGKVLAAPLPKPAYVRKPHLTDHPFRGHDGLKELKKQMESNKPPRRGQRRPNKEKK